VNIAESIVDTSIRRCRHETLESTDKTATIRNLKKSLSKAALEI